MAGIDNIRVKVNKKYHPVYRVLTQELPTRHKIFEQHGDLFTLCAVLGARAGRRSEDRREFLFWSWTLNKYQQTALTALAVSESNEYDILAKPEKIIQVAESYADTGMEILFSEVLEDYRTTDENGGYTLEFGNADQLEKTILGFVQTESNQDPLS